MINDIKKGIKLMRYGYGLKSLVIIGIIYIICGILILGMWLFTPGNSKLGTQGIFLLIIPLLLVQLLHSLNISKIALSSPMRKKLQTSIPSVISCMGMLIIYIFFILYCLLAISISPDRAGNLCVDIVFEALSAALIMIYMPICCKYMVASILLFMILYMTLTFTYVFNAPEIEFFNNANVFTFLCVAALGILFIIIFGFVGYLLSLLVYKAPVSKYSQNVYLRKELQ
ncbi:MAG: hypothetical protein NC433_14745 [Clostridiales bacterium]|nr:hypothetical protein [Clostridiales bacterium]